MTILILSLVIAGLGIGGFFWVKYLITSKRELKEDLSEEKLRSAQYLQAMQDNKNLADKAQEIDKGIEVRRNERKKLSKKDKLAAANNRG